MNTSAVKETALYAEGIFCVIVTANPFVCVHRQIDILICWINLLFSLDAKHTANREKCSMAEEKPSRQLGLWGPSYV